MGWGCFDRITQLEETNASSDGCHAVPDGSWNSLFCHLDLIGHSLYVPESYAPGYSYPLICYMHDEDRSERDLRRWFPGISDQNYIGLGLRAPFPGRRALPGQFRWRADRADATTAILQAAVNGVRADWNIHPERVVLFGDGAGSLAAWQQFFLSQAGMFEPDLEVERVILRNLPCGWPRILPPVPEGLTGSVLLLSDCRSGEEMAALDGLSEAGLNVHCVSPNDAQLTDKINRWVLAGIPSVVY